MTTHRPLRLPATASRALALTTMAAAMLAMLPAARAAHFSDGEHEYARGRILIDIQYRVRATNTFYNLVYPFYLLEATPT